MSPDPAAPPAPPSVTPAPTRRPPRRPGGLRRVAPRDDRAARAARRLAHLVAHLGRRLRIDDAGRRFDRAVAAIPTWLVAGLVAVPVLAAVVAALARGFTPAGDEALLELMVRDVGGSGTPLVGPYSRYGWNHPGPLLYYAIAPAYRLLGGSGGAMLASVSLLNLASIAGILALAHRRGGRALLVITAVVTALLVHRLDATFLWDPWNPYSTMLPFMALVLLTWTVVDGERWAVPVSVAVASFVVQSHIGYAALVAVLGACQVLGLLRLHRRREFADHGTAVRRRGWELAATTGAVAVVCWAPVLLDALRGGDNLARMVTYFRTDALSAGPATALSVAARHLAPRAPWTTGVEMSDANGGGVLGAPLGDLVVPVAAFALAALAARRVRAASALRFQGVVAACTVAGVAATARVTAPVYGYLVKWWWVLAALWWTSIAWSLWSAMPRRARAPVRAVALATGAAVLVSIAYFGSVRLWDTPMPADGWKDKLGPLSTAAIARLRVDGPVQVRSTGSIWGNVGDTMRNELDRAGYAVVVDPIDTFKYGEHRSTANDAPAATVWVVAADAVDAWEERTDTCELAVWDPLEPDERARYRILAKQLDYQLERSHRHDIAVALATDSSLWEAYEIPTVDRKLVEEVDSLRWRGERTAVFLEFPDHRPACTEPPARI